MSVVVPVPPACSTAYVPKVWHDVKGSWQTFHQQWWGGTGAARLQAAYGSGSLHIEQGDVCRDLEFFNQTSGRVCLSRRLEAAYASIVKSHSAAEGVVYIGQPGSGRSFLLFFVLLCRMAAAEPFYYTTSQGKTYRFDDTGVAVAPTRNLIRFDILCAESPPWSLVDSNADGSSPPYAVASRAVFTVHMTGVRESEYKWMSRASNGSNRRLLDPFTCAEILECLPLCIDFCRLPKTMQEAYMTEPAVAAVVAQSGPFMHDVLGEIMHPGRAAADIEKHLQPMTSVDELFNLLGGLLLNDRPEFNALFVRRRDPRAAVTGIDLFVMEFKSRLASTCFIAQMRLIGIERIKTVAMDRDMNPRSMLGAWIERLFALEESADVNVWQVSVGMFDIFPTW